MPRKSAYSLWVAIPVLTTLNQACIKLLAERTKAVPFGWSWLVHALQVPWMAGILLCEVMSFALWLTILADTGISKAAPITAIAYLLILLMSWTAFHETIMPLQVAGSILILIGVWLIGVASTQSTTGT